MMVNYPTYKYTEDDVKNNLARFVRLDNPNSYPFDNYHAHEYNEMLVFTKGGGTHNINFKNNDICSNSIHLLAAHDLHWLERSMDSTGFAIVYQDQFLHKLQMVNPDIDFYGLLNYSRVINLDEEEAKSFGFLFNEIIGNKAQSAYMLQLIGTLITKIAITKYDTPVTEKIYDPLISEVIKLIEKNFKQQLSLSAYSEMLFIAPRTLQNRISKASGKTIKELQKERLLKEAKRLICTTNLSIGEICMDLGFGDMAYFANWFKKHTGVPPSEYKYGS